MGWRDNGLGMESFLEQRRAFEYGSIQDTVSVECICG